MAGTAGERPHGLVNGQTVDAVLDAIDQALIAATECEQRGRLNQVNSAVSGVAGGDRPRPGRRRVDTSSGDAPLDLWITRSGC
jgi:hypothetical protein